MIILFILALLPYQKGEDVHTTTVSGTVFCQDGKGSIPLGGASISLVAGKDTLHTVSDNQGHYSFNFEQIFEVAILAKYQGFDDFREIYQIYGKRTAIAIQMKRSKQLLDAANIKSEIPFVRSDADTVIYNMAALEKMEGDRALSLLLQIPGFSIDGGRIMVWGEYVDKTYVNGKLIFGDNPMSALTLLKADEVKNVRVYDTQKMEAIQRGLKHSKKRRVIDIQTFNHFLSAVDIQAQLRVGTLLEKQESSGMLRYSSGLDFDSDSEMQQLGLHVNGNNINNSQNGLEVTNGILPALYSDCTQTEARCEYVKKWDDAEWGKSLSFDYSYDCDKTISESETVIDRIGTVNGIAPQYYTQMSLSQSRLWSHSAMIGTDLHDTPLKDVGLFMKLSFDDNMSDCVQNILNDSGTSGIQRQEQQSGASGRQFSFSSQFNWSNPHAKSGWVPDVIFVASTSSNPQHTYAEDTLASSTTRRQLDGNGAGMETALFGSFRLFLIKKVSV